MGDNFPWDRGGSDNPMMADKSQYITENTLFVVLHGFAESRNFSVNLCA